MARLLGSLKTVKKISSHRTEVTINSDTEGIVKALLPRLEVENLQTKLRRSKKVAYTRNRSGKIITITAYVKKT